MINFLTSIIRTIWIFILIAISTHDTYSQKYYLKDNVYTIKGFERQFFDFNDKNKKMLSNSILLLQEGYYKSTTKGGIAKVTKPTKSYSWSGTEWKIDLIVRFYNDVTEVGHISDNSEYYEFYLEHYKGNCYCMLLENGCNGAIFTSANQFYSSYDYNDYAFIKPIE